MWETSSLAVRVLLIRRTGRTHKKIDAQLPLFQQNFVFNNLFTFYYSKIGESMEEVSEEFIQTYPELRTTVV